MPSDKRGEIVRFFTRRGKRCDCAQCRVGRSNSSSSLSRVDRRQAALQADRWRLPTCGTCGLRRWSTRDHRGRRFFQSSVQACQPEPTARRGSERRQTAMPLRGRRRGLSHHIRAHFDRHVPQDAERARLLNGGELEGASPVISAPRGGPQRVPRRALRSRRGSPGALPSESPSLRRRSATWRTAPRAARDHAWPLLRNACHRGG